MDRLRLVVMRSRSEDERPDVVHWANSSRQTGKMDLYFDLGSKLTFSLLNVSGKSDLSEMTKNDLGLTDRNEVICHSIIIIRIL